CWSSASSSDRQSRSLSAARHDVHVLGGGRERVLLPGVPTVLGAEDLAAPGGAVHAVGISAIQRDGHHGGARLDAVVEARPGLPQVVAAVESPRLAPRGRAETGVEHAGIVGRDLDVARVRQRGEVPDLHVLPAGTAVDAPEQAHARRQEHGPGPRTAQAQSVRVQHAFDVGIAHDPALEVGPIGELDQEGMLDAHALCLSGARPGAVFLALRMGLFRSADRGSSWEDMEIRHFSPLTYARDVQVSPVDARVLYACLSPAARSEAGTLYRSSDLGETWTRFDHGVKSSSTMVAVAHE